MIANTESQPDRCRSREASKRKRKIAGRPKTKTAPAPSNRWTSCVNSTIIFLFVHSSGGDDQHFSLQKIRGWINCTLSRFFFCSRPLHLTQPRDDSYIIISLTWIYPPGRCPPPCRARRSSAMRCNPHSGSSDRTVPS